MPETTPAETPKAKSSIPPAYRGVLRITGVVACALVAAAPWVAMAAGAELDTTAAAGVSISALSGLLAILGKKIALSLIPISGGAVGASAAEVLKALGVLVVVGVLAGCAAGSENRARGCAAWHVAHEVAHEVADRLCDGAPARDSPEPEQ